MPSGHARSAAVSRRLSLREKWILAGVCGLLAALVVAVALALLSAGHSSANGCVDVALPYSTGGAEVYRCGAAARAICRSVSAPGGYRGQTGRTVGIQCRKAGLAVG